MIGNNYLIAKRTQNEMQHMIEISDLVDGMAQMGPIASGRMANPAFSPGFPTGLPNWD